MAPGPRTMPSTATVLGIVGMIAYPLCLVGLANAVAYYVHPVVGWAVALAGAGAAGLPKLLRDLDARETAAGQRAYQDRPDAVGRYTPAPPPTTPTGSPAPSGPAGPAVGQPWLGQTPGP